MRCAGVLLTLALALSSGGPAMAGHQVTVSAHASGESFGSQPRYDLTDLKAGGKLSTYTATAEGGLADGFWSRCSASASFGRVRTTVANAAYPSTLGVDGAAGCTTEAVSNDEIIAAAPGVAVGEPMTYTARVSLSTSTPGPMDSSHFVGVCVKLAADSVCSDHSGTDADVSGTYSVRVKTTAGSRLVLAMWVNSSVWASYRGSQSASAGIDKVARLKLTSDKDGANITGESGYTYK